MRLGGWLQLGGEGMRLKGVDVGCESWKPWQACRGAGRWATCPEATRTLEYALGVGVAVAGEQMGHEAAYCIWYKGARVERGSKVK